MAHTPGPWWVDPDYYGDVQCAKGEIASAFRWWNNGAEWEIRGAFATNDECRANARLIAVAPDLLTELRRSNDMLQTLLLFASGSLRDGMIAQINANAQAIAKAEGQS